MRQGVREQGAPGRAPRTRTGSPAASRSTTTTCASSCCRRSATATSRRCATSRGSRSPPSGAAATARACSASTSSASAARSGCAPSPAARRRPSPTRRPRPGLTRDQIRRFEQLLRRELERAQIERTQALPPSRPLNELDRALPIGPLQDLAAVHRVVAQLKRRLATQGHETRGRKRHAHVDVRRTMRASLQTGGVPVVLKYRPRRPKRPELYVLCDVSTSVTSASVFFLERAARAARRVPQDALVRVRRADLRGHRGLRARALLQGRLGRDLQGRRRRRRLAATPTTAASGASSSPQVADDLHPRATVIVLGDARTNGRDPRADVFASIVALRRPHVLAQPRAAAVLELRRLGDLRLRAALRGLRVLDHAPARGLRQGAHPPLRYDRTWQTTPRHARAIIDANSYMVLGTADASGLPWASPVWFATVDHRSSSGSPTGCAALAQPRRAAAAGDRDLRLDRRPRRAAPVYMSAIAEEVTGLTELERGPGRLRRGSEARACASGRATDVQPPGPPSPLPRGRVRALPPRRPRRAGAGQSARPRGGSRAAPAASQSMDRASYNAVLLGEQVHQQPVAPRAVGRPLVAAHHARRAGSRPLCRRGSRARWRRTGRS